MDLKSLQTLTRAIKIELQKLALASGKAGKSGGQPEVPSLELEGIAREMTDIARDEKLTGKQKTARLKALLAEIQQLGASASSSTEQTRQGGVETRAEKTASSASVAASARHSGDPRLFVLDQRRGAGSELGEAMKGITKASRAQGAEKEAGSTLAQQRVDQGAGTASSSALRAKATQGSPFAGALEKLREIAAPELVKTAGIILRDGGDGEIRLVLKPESLGSVRIRMNLVDNTIEGRIIVDSAAVKQVFDGSIDALAKALAAEGFQTGALEVSVGGQGSGEGRSTPEPSSQGRRESSGEFARNIPGIESVSLGDLLVNLFV